jgi:predicted DNA-binding transcriptional regulator YafY
MNEKSCLFARNPADKLTPGRCMVPFKPFIHRIYSIDKKVREQVWPTTVSIARDYQARYGLSVNSRTIAADIAALKHDFRAPLKFSYQKRGYYYADPNFRLPVLQNDGEDALPLMAEEVHPRTASLPDWQQLFLSSLLDKVLPLNAPVTPDRVSVLLDRGAAEDPAFDAVQRPLIQAVNHTTACEILYRYSAVKPIRLIFKPLHLICTLGTNLVFGRVQEGLAERYALLYLDRIRDVTPRSESGVLPSYIYIQSTGNRDIEVVMARENSDLLLVFIPRPDSASRKFPPEYVLLAQTEIFASFG